MALKIEELQVLVSANAEQFRGEFLKLNKQLDSLQKVAKSAGTGVERNLFPSLLKANLATSIITKSLGILNQSLGVLKTNLLSSIDTTQKFESALIGLETVAGRKLGMQAIPLATQAAKDLAADGLLPVQNAATGLKNLLASGFNLEEATNLMYVFKDSAAFGRQSALSFGDAVSSATEGIKNGNSILVDNAGITKNLSMILTEAGYSQQDLMRATTDAGVRQALYNGLLKEGALFQGDAARLAGTTAGQLARISATLINLKVAMGQFIKPIQSVVQGAVLSFLGGVLSSLNGSESTIMGFANRIAGYMLAVFRIIGTLLSRLPIIGKNFENLANLSIASTSKGVGNLTGGMNSLGDSIDKTTGNAKELKKELLGLASFDEMNVISAPESSSGGSGSGGGVNVPEISAGGGIGATAGLDATEINKFADQAMEEFAALKKRIDEFLAPLREITIAGKPLLDWFMDIAKWIGIFNIGLGVAKFILGPIIGAFGGLLGILGPVKAGLTTIAGVIGGISTPVLVVVGVIAALVAGFILLYNSSEQFRNSVNELVNGALTWIQENIAPIIDQIVIKVQEMIAVFQEKWPAIQAAVQPLIDSIGNFLVGAFKLLGEIIDWVWKTILKPLVDFILANIVPAFSLVIDIVTGVISVIAKVASFIIDLLMPILNALWDVVKFVFESIKSVVEFVWGKIIQPILKALWDFISGFIIPIFQLLLKVGQMVFEKIREVVEAAWNRIYGAIKPVIDWINEKIMPVINKVKDGIEQAFNGVKSTVENIWNGIGNIIKGAINWIIDKINGFIQGVNDLLQGLDNVSSTLGISVSFRVGKIPRLAKGGVIDGPTVAMLGEAGKEAVVPLENNTQWIDQLAEKIQGAGGGGVNIVVKLGEETIYSKFVDYINDRSKAENAMILNI